jgi:hypothetical protein
MRSPLNPQLSRPYHTLAENLRQHPNNAAERAIRPGVLWRKGSFGTQSPEGSRFVEAMMTVVATLKQQHRDVLNYVTAACEAALCGEPAPSLLPTLDALNQVVRPAA